MKKALSLKTYLMDNMAANKNEVDVGWISEDWDSIGDLVKNSRMLLSDAVYDIIRSVKVSDGKEEAIKKLGGGLPYYYMEENIFPRVGRVEYTLSFRGEEMSVDTAKAVLRRNPSEMTLKELYSVAESYGRGCREFDDIVDLSACLFPYSAEANINAAAVAMLGGELKQAERYLYRWRADPRAFEDMGVLSLLEGDRQKAVFYFGLAEADGVPQAKAALSSIDVSGK